MTHSSLILPYRLNDVIQVQSLICLCTLWFLLIQTEKLLLSYLLPFEQLITETICCQMSYFTSSDWLNWSLIPSRKNKRLSSHSEFIFPADIPNNLLLDCQEKTFKITESQIITVTLVFLLHPSLQFVSVSLWLGGTLAPHAVVLCLSPAGEQWKHANMKNLLVIRVATVRHFANV